MVINMDEYASLRREFIKVAKFHIKTETLNVLKIFYRDVINSIRIFDDIQDIEALVRVLEKRGAIRYNNITPLKYIAKCYLSHSTINDKLENYDAWVKGHTFPYSPQTNLYQLNNGEFHRTEKTRLENLSPPAAHTSQSNLNQNIHSPHRNEFSRESPLGIVIGDNSSNCNNSAVLFNSVILPLDNNFTFNGSNGNNCDKRSKDCKAHDVLHKLFNVSQRTENFVSAVVTPSDLIAVNERVCNSSGSRHSSTEDIGRTLPNTPLLATPLPVEPQARVSSLKKSSSIDNVKTLRSRFHTLIERRYVRNSTILLSIAIILVTLLIVYGFSKNPVHYNPEPSAPPFQEVPNIRPGTSGNLCAGYSSELEQNRYGVHHATRPSTGPLQTLSEKEARLQNYIFEQLSKRMGRFWQDVARQLDIRECEINNIDKQYPDFQDKAYAALKLFANETNLQYWQSTLKKALEKARRKDLAETVENISNYK